MSNLTHYVDLRAATDVDDEFGSEVFIRALFSTLHRARAELKHDLPLDFPECINGSNSPQAAGNLVRVFGSKLGVEALLAYPPIQNLVARDIFDSTGALETPKSAPLVHVRRVRPTATAVAVNKKIAHLKAHFDKKGFTWTGAYERERRRHFQSAKDAKHPYVMVTSNTTENAYSVMFDRIPSKFSCNHLFDSYGFGQNGSCVPLI
ncbi:type I-F CRISPR-associated endoribonuclease Cas6/Csy4 [Pseudomonas syringae pv. actinidiae]|nr:type I-F CRISPR-associated endoribonuclease Cas6/Csy4 [Pseudomonas syringae pv. actinidiae]